jgi:5-methylcytosine-specific restriction protein A
MPIAPPRACGVCGQIGCVDHRKPAWRLRGQDPAPRLRGRPLDRARAELFREQPFCAVCRRAVATQRDHVVPLAEGGPETRANTQALCDECHRRKTVAEATRGSRRSTTQ